MANKHCNRSRVIKASRFASNSGFSLIELLIVLTIMGLLTSIVMPESFNMLEQHQAQLEQKQLVNFIKAKKHQAYLQEAPLTVEFNGRTLDSSDGEQMVFEHLSAEDQTIKISSLGSFDQEQIEYYLRGAWVTKELVDL